MIRVALSLSLLVGCVGGPIPGAEEAAAICSAFCDRCGAEDCEEICLDQWHLYGGHSDPELRECAARYLIGRECQALRGCDEPGCGSPSEDLLFCAESLS